MFIEFKKNRNSDVRRGLHLNFKDGEFKMMQVKTLIQELQDDILNKNYSLQEVLRLALYVSIKLNLPDFESWINFELEGYLKKEDVPSYRYLYAPLKGLNHIRGEWQPINDGEQFEIFIKQPIGELESLAKKSKKLHVPLSAELKSRIRKNITYGCSPQEIAYEFDSEQVLGIVNKVRNDILKWAMKLEKAGIKGEGRLFSEQEIKLAKQGGMVNNYYANEQSIINSESINGSQVSQGNRGANQSLVQNSLDKELLMDLLKDINAQVHLLDLTADKKSEINAEIDVLNAQVKSPIPKCGIIREALISLKNIFENTVSGVMANVLTKISLVLITC